MGSWTLSNVRVLSRSREEWQILVSSVPLYPDLEKVLTRSQFLLKRTLSVAMPIFYPLNVGSEAFGISVNAKS